CERTPRPAIGSLELAAKSLETSTGFQRRMQAEAVWPGRVGRISTVAPDREPSRFAAARYGTGRPKRIRGMCLHSLVLRTGTVRGPFLPPRLGSGGTVEMR